MDVNLLSKLLKELIIDNEQVPLTGMGYFTTEPVPAYFSEDGKTIFPPSRKIYFKSDERTESDLIWKYYAKEYGIEESTAKMEVETFMKQLELTYLNKKSIEFPELGRLLYTNDRESHFINDTEAGFFPSVFGFEQVILKPSNRQQAAGIAEGTAETAQAETAPASKHKPETKTQPAASIEQAPIPDSIKPKEGKKMPAWAIILIIVSVILVLAVAFFILARMGMFDSLLYTPEELRIIEGHL